jgi:hypothetical protein
VQSCQCKCSGGSYVHGDFVALVDRSCKASATTDWLVLLALLSRFGKSSRGKVLFVNVFIVQLKAYTKVNKVGVSGVCWPSLPKTASHGVHSVLSCQQISFTRNLLAEYIMHHIRNLECWARGRTWIPSHMQRYVRSSICLLLLLRQ